MRVRLRRQLMLLLLLLMLLLLLHLQNLQLLPELLLRRVHRRRVAGNAVLHEYLLLSQLLLLESLLLLQELELLQQGIERAWLLRLLLLRRWWLPR